MATQKPANIGCTKAACSKATPVARQPTANPMARFADSPRIKGGASAPTPANVAITAP